MYQGFSDFVVNEVDFANPYDVRMVKKFLEKFHIDYIPYEADKTIILETSSGEMVGTGSCQNNVLKLIAVDPKFQGSNAFSTIVSTLSEDLLPVFKHVFVYTHPKNKDIFIGLGFKLIAEALPYYSLYEFGFTNIKDYQKYLKSKKKNGQKVAAIVANCNPFTNGHKYLIEKASEENDVVYVFVVEAELSVFPFKVRWKLINEGTKHLKNVVLIRSGDYLVSEVSFPRYFLKGEDGDEVTANQAKLDLTIFANHVAPTLGITRRYVGTENYCMTTAIYNEQMKKVLPEKGLEVVEVKRKAVHETDFISASAVRKAITDDQWDLVKEKVPETTYNFLNSKEAESIIRRIKINNARH